MTSGLDFFFVFFSFTLSLTKTDVHRWNGDCREMVYFHLQTVQSGNIYPLHVLFTGAKFLNSESRDQTGYF